MTPTKAVLGFCKKNGVEPADLEKDGEYVWANVKTVGRSAVEVLGDALPSIIGGLNFPKTMRWCGNDTFSRPVRWLLAMHGDHQPPFVAVGVPSGSTTRLLRNSATPVAEVTGAAHHAELLEGDAIEISFDKRREAIWTAAQALAADVGGVRSRLLPAEAGGLIDEVINLIEAPTPILGGFDPAFLALPKEVLVMVMRKHQRYFPVEDPTTGDLLLISSPSPTATWTTTPFVSAMNPCSQRGTSTRSSSRRTRAKPWRISSPIWRASPSRRNSERCSRRRRASRSWRRSSPSRLRLLRRGCEDRGRGGTREGGPRHAAGDGVHLPGGRHG